MLNTVTTVASIAGMLAVTVYAGLSLHDQRSLVDEQYRQIERQAEEIERIAPQLVACQDAAEVAERLNDAWHVWVGEQTVPNADAVEAAQDQLMHLIEACRGEDAEPTTEGVAV